MCRQLLMSSRAVRGRTTAASASRCQTKRPAQQATSRSTIAPACSGAKGHANLRQRWQAMAQATEEQATEEQAQAMAMERRVAEDGGHNLFGRWRRSLLGAKLSSCKVSSDVGEPRRALRLALCLRLRSASSPRPSSPRPSPHLTRISAAAGHPHSALRVRWFGRASIAHSPMRTAPSCTGPSLMDSFRRSLIPPCPPLMRGV